VITVRGVAGPAVRAAFGDVEVSAVGDTTVLRRAGYAASSLRCQSARPRAQMKIPFFQEEISHDGKP
jgi:hypothetical protein